MNDDRNMSNNMDGAQTASSSKIKMEDNLEEHKEKMVLVKHGVTTYPAKLVSSAMINGNRKAWIQWDSRKRTDCVDWGDIIFDLPPRRRSRKRERGPLL